MCGSNKMVPQRETQCNFFREHFPERLISLRGDLPWPARSPDLNLCDFFLWGYLKSIVYNDRPQTLLHLKNNIRNAIADIPVSMLERVEENLKKRVTRVLTMEAII